MVGIAQLVRAPGCGPGGRGFESHYSPHLHTVMLRKDTLGCRQVVRHGTLTPAFVGSNPATPAKTQYCDSLAQVVEHLTFNQGVRGSNPRRVTKKRTGRMASSFFDGDIRGGIRRVFRRLRWRKSEAVGGKPRPGAQASGGENPRRVTTSRWTSRQSSRPNLGGIFFCSVIAPLPHKGTFPSVATTFVGPYFPSRKICI